MLCMYVCMCVYVCVYVCDDRPHLLWDNVGWTLKVTQTAAVMGQFVIVNECLLC
jgi:hypothetical protein